MCFEWTDRISIAKGVVRMNIGNMKATVSYEPSSFFLNSLIRVTSIVSPYNLKFSIRVVPSPPILSATNIYNKHNSGKWGVQIMSLRVGI